MAELAHDVSSCLVCRARSEAPRGLVQVAALFLAGLCITSGILDLRPARTDHRTTAVPRVEPAAPPKPGPANPAQARPARSHAREAAAAALERGAATSFGRSFFANGSVVTTAA